jgi:hypothetical protein
LHLRYDADLIAQVDIDEPEKWVLTEEKVAIFKEQRKISNTNFKPPAEGLRMCEMCRNVYEKHQWKNHAKFEVLRRKGTAKICRDQGGKFRCPIDKCFGKSFKTYQSIWYHISHH